MPELPGLKFYYLKLRSSSEIKLSLESNYGKLELAYRYLTSLGKFLLSLHGANYYREVRWF